MTELSEKMIVVEKVHFEGLLQRLDRLEKIVTGNHEDTLFQERVNRLARGGMVDTNAICELMGWSRRTFSRRLMAGEIPVIQDGRKYKMSVDDFLKWHEKNYQQ